jgi:hypothetical protein
MDSESVLYDIEHLAGAGVILPTEIKAAIQSSLVALKHAERFSSLQFWGKITGVVRDYYIAQASHDSPIVGKKSFYRYGCAAMLLWVVLWHFSFIRFRFAAWTA